VIATTPSVPGQPRKFLSTLDSITIEFDAPANDGGSPIINYEVKLESAEGQGFTTVGYTTGQTWT
jgi:hypothetical protein